MTVTKNPDAVNSFILTVCYTFKKTHFYIARDDVLFSELTFDVKVATIYPNTKRVK